MSNEMTVICSTCSQQVRYSANSHHDEECTSDDYSDIGVVEQEEEKTRTDRWGDTVEKRTHPHCEICETDLFETQVKYHRGRCKEDSHSDIAVVDEDTAPKCTYCDSRTSPEDFNEHSRRCAVEDAGSDYGVLEEE